MHLTTLHPRAYLLIQALLLLALVCVITIPHRMLLDAPMHDSGLHFYGGWRVLQGDVPYRDFWDDRPPAIYWVNALGLWLGAGSTVGVHVLECLALWLASFILFGIMRKNFGLWGACVGMLLFFCGLFFVLEGGNFAEPYTLPLQSLIVWVWLRVFQQPTELNRWDMPAGLIGVLTSVCLLFKPNLIGAGAASMVLLALESLQHKRWRVIIALVIGSLIPLMIFVAYFGVVGGLDTLYETHFVFAPQYLTAAFMDRVRALATGLRLLTKSGISLFGGVGFGVLLWQLIKRQPISALGRLLLLWLPIECALTTLAGIGLAHYFVAPMPCLALVSAYGMAHLIRNRVARQQRRFGLAAMIVPVVASAIFSGAYLYDIQRHRISNLRLVRAADYIAQHSDPADTVMAWVTSPAIYFFAQRRAASHFVFYFPQLAVHYSKQRDITLALMRDLRAHPPKFIVDTVGPDEDIPRLSVLNAAERAPAYAKDPQRWGEVPETQQIFDFVNDHYRIVPAIHEPRLVLYERL